MALRVAHALPPGVCPQSSTPWAVPRQRNRVQVHGGGYCDGRGKFCGLSELFIWTDSVDYGTKAADARLPLRSGDIMKEPQLHLWTPSSAQSIEAPGPTVGRRITRSRSPVPAPRWQARAWPMRAGGLDLITVIGFAAYLSLTPRLAADTIYVSNYGDSTVTRITADGQKQTYASGLRSALRVGLRRPGQSALRQRPDQPDLQHRHQRNGARLRFRSALRQPDRVGFRRSAAISMLPTRTTTWWFASSRVGRRRILRRD